MDACGGEGINLLKTRVKTEGKKESLLFFSFVVRKKLDMSMFIGRNKGKWKRLKIYKWERTKIL